MNVASFIFIVTVLSFATGFFVAAIIWVIKWSILSDENKKSPKQVVAHLLSGLFQYHSKQSDNLSFTTNSDVMNKELYRYYHGKN